MRFRTITKQHCLIKGHGYRPGEEVRIDISAKELALLINQGTVEPGYPNDESDAAGRLVMYRGEKNVLIAPEGVMYRCIPVRAEEWHEDIAGFPESDIVRIPENAVYVGSGVTLENFEDDIACAISKNPKVLFIRDCGAGDVIMSTVAVREFRKRIPGAEITYATLPQHTHILEGADFIDHVVSVHEMELEKYSLIVNWSRAVENYRIERNRGSRILSFAKHMGMDEVQDTLPYFKPFQEDRLRADELLKGCEGHPVVGYVMRAAAWNRTWPLWWSDELCKEIRNRIPNSRIVLVDADAAVGFEGDGIINLCGKTDSFGAAAAVLEKCNVVVTPDTGLAHACGAMGVATLVIMGSIPPAKRYSHYSNFEFIYPEGKVDCCPCWDWQRVYEEGEKKGLPMSCHDTGNNKCLEAVTPEEIAKNAAELFQRIKLPKVSVCILTHTGGMHLEKCLSAIQRAKFHGEILVLVNGAKDVADKIRVKEYKVTFICEKENIGIIRGRNKLAKHAGAEKLLFLDDDQYVSGDSIKKLMQTMEETGSKIVCAVANVTDDFGFGKPIKERKGSKKEYGGAGGMLVEKKVFDELGGFDEVFGMAYCEDSDFCWRAAEKGFRWEWCEEAGIDHDEHATLHSQKTFDNKREHEESHRILREHWDDRLIPLESIGKLGFRNAHLLSEYKNSNAGLYGKKKKKVLMVADTPDWAVARNVDAIKHRLGKKYEIHKACFSNVRVGGGGRGYMPLCAADLTSYDLVVVRILLHMPESDFQKIRKLRPEKVAVTIPAYHCFDDERFTGIFRERVKCCKNIFCVSDGIFERTAEHFRDSDKNVYFTPQGIDTNKFFNRRNTRNREFTVGWAGNVMHGHPRDHKRFFEIILPLIEKMHGECMFKLAARGITDPVKRGLESMGVEVAVVDFDGMAEFYNSVDLLLNASMSEAIASTTCEAMACGTPMVTTPVGHAENIIVHGQNGLIVGAEVGQFCDAVRYFMGADYGKIFSINRYVAEEVYNWNVLAEYTDLAMEFAIESGATARGSMKYKAN